MRVRLLTLAVAGVFFMGSVGGAAAANQSMSTIEELSVAATTTLTGVPASLSYGTGLASDLRTAVAAGLSWFEVNASSNNAAGLTLAVAASDLTAGGNTIAATQRRVNAEDATGCTLEGGFGTFPGKAYTGPANSDMTICARTSPGSLSTVITLSIQIPAEAATGAYTGTVTFKAIEN